MQKLQSDYKDFKQVLKPWGSGWGTPITSMIRWSMLRAAYDPEGIKTVIERVLKHLSQLYGRQLDTLGDLHAVLER